MSAAADLLLSVADRAGSGHAAVLISGEQALLAGSGGPDSDPVTIAGTGEQTAADSLRVSAGGSVGAVGLSPLGEELVLIDDPERRTTARPVQASLEVDAMPTLALEGPAILWSLPPAAGDDAPRRALWATLESGVLLLAAGIRPAGAGGHGEESLAAATVSRAGEPSAYAEPLLSTEYDSAGAQLRATLELWREAEDELPERGGGLRTAGTSSSDDARRLEAARFDWRLEGVPGFGCYEIVTGSG